jgi:hypothetical protein
MDPWGIAQVCGVRDPSVMEQATDRLPARDPWTAGRRRDRKHREPNYFGRGLVSVCEAWGEDVIRELLEAPNWAAGREDGKNPHERSHHSKPQPQ